MSTIEIQDLRPLRGAVRGAIIKGEDWQASIKQLGTIARCNRLLKRAEQEAEKIRINAFDEGFAAGKSKALEQMSEQLLEFRERGDQQLHDLAKQLQDLAMAVVERVIPQVETEDLVSALVHEAIDSIQGSRRLKIKVHPGAKDRIETELSAIRDRSPGLEALEVLTDPGFSVEECLLQSEVGEVRASWAIHAAAIKNLLESQRLQNEQQ